MPAAAGGLLAAASTDGAGAASTAGFGSAALTSGTGAAALRAASLTGARPLVLGSAAFARADRSATRLTSLAVAAFGRWLALPVCFHWLLVGLAFGDSRGVYF